MRAAGAPTAARRAAWLNVKWFSAAATRCLRLLTGQTRSGAPSVERDRVGRREGITSDLRPVFRLHFVSGRGRDRYYKVRVHDSQYWQCIGFLSSARPIASFSSTAATTPTARASSSATARSTRLCTHALDVGHAAVPFAVLRRSSPLWFFGRLPTRLRRPCRWHALGITSSMPNFPAVFIQGTAHCADMSMPRDSDPPALTEGREKVLGQLDEWLALP